jgi:hypothetical protein
MEAPLRIKLDYGVPKHRQISYKRPRAFIISIPVEKELDKDKSNESKIFSAYKNDKVL